MSPELFNNLNESKYNLKNLEKSNLYSLGIIIL